MVLGIFIFNIKHVVQDDSRLDFEVHINRESLDILEGAYTLTIQDTMTPNLSVYWDTIRLTYENENGAVGSVVVSPSVFITATDALMCIV